MSDNIDLLKETEKENLILDEHDIETDDHKHGRVVSKSNDHWVGGIILITIGSFFLITRTTNIYINNWWALFILCPGILKLLHAAQSYREIGRFSEQAREAFTWGLILILVACTFFFNWSWGLIWPVFLIIFGIGAVLSGIFE